MDEAIGLYVSHNPWVWGLFAAFLIVLSYIVYVILQHPAQANQPTAAPHIPFPTIPAHSEDEETEEELMECPACGEEYLSGTEDRFCYRCRYPLGPNCPGCKAELKKWEDNDEYDFLSFCPTCGYQLCNMQNIDRY